MKHPRTVTAGALAAGALAILPTSASAHPVQVCTGAAGPEAVNPQPYRGATLVGLTPQPDGRVVATWSDGYVSPPFAPSGACAPEPQEPTPTPTPATPEVTPEGQPVKPVTCADLLALYPKAGAVRRASWGCPVTPKAPPPLLVSKSVRTLRAVGCVLGPNPRRSYRVDRIRVEWRRGGRLVKVRIRDVRVVGSFCPQPPVTG